jgi:homospermidine synthase
MTLWPQHATWNGPIVMIGLGSIGRGTLPLILRHIACDRNRFTIIDPDDHNKHLADKEGIAFIKAAVTQKNYKSLLTPLLTAGPSQAFIVNLSVDVSSVDIQKLAQATNSLYIDTVVEPWPGFYYNSKLGNEARTNYELREQVLALKEKYQGGHTSVSCCGANPGMVSWYVKRALLDIAAETGVKVAEPKTRAEWGKFMKRLGVKGIHIAERDTQRSRKPKPLDTFVNTWSVEGFISEGLQPAELGWGTHEKKLPAGGRKHKTGCGAAIYITRPGAETKVRSWTPTPGPQYGFLVTHNEAISIADYFTVRESRKVTYRPTCHYAYHPANDAVLSLHEMFGNGGRKQSHIHILDEDEIIDGRDELGVLIYGHRKNAYWYGSQLTIEEARKLAPYQNATGLQVTSAVLAGMVWAIENPRAGVVETDEMDFHRCLEIQLPYLGQMTGVYTNWTPLTDRQTLFAEDTDRHDPWQFTNIIVK